MGNPLELYEEGQGIMPETIALAIETQKRFGRTTFNYINSGERTEPLLPVPAECEGTFFEKDKKLSELREKLSAEFPHLHRDQAFPLFLLIEYLPYDHPFYVKPNKKKRKMGKTAIVVAWVGVVFNKN